MLQYIIILLDDTAVSYCHYQNSKKERKLISLEDLKAGILFAMKENLMVQFVYPEYDLPLEYKKAIEIIDHNDIMPSVLSLSADVVVIDGWNDWQTCTFRQESAYVLRTSKRELFINFRQLKGHLPEITRLNVVITDIENFEEVDFTRYKEVLTELNEELKLCLEKGILPQLNLLTDRIMLNRMNNCNAGWENVTLAPDGKFYVCPAFYQDKNGYSIGSLKEGLDIRNSQLYKLPYAPLCRKCDAYQCKRCIYLNWKTTLEVNTPSHEQCVVAHLERNASRALLSAVRQSGDYLIDKKIEIEEITYLDPFDIRKDL